MLSFISFHFISSLFVFALPEKSNNICPAKGYGEMMSPQNLTLNENNQLARTRVRDSGVRIERTDDRTDTGETRESTDGQTNE